MKHFEKLAEFAAENNIILNGTEQMQFHQFSELLIEMNKKMNLTAITDPEEIEIKHFIDSIAAAPAILDLWKRMQNKENSDLTNENADFRLADVGTGAGFPGLPLKIVFPVAEFLLLDSLEKRIGFVNHVISELKLEHITAKAGRAEDFGKTGNVSRETFDFCVSRAVAATPVLAEYCLPLVKVSGCCILMKSGEYKKELEEAEQAIRTLGGEVEDIKESVLYGTDAGRSLIIIRKTKATPDKYPRRPGKPSKSPIR